MTLRHCIHAALAAIAFSTVLPAFADTVPDAAAQPPSGSLVTAVQSPAWLVHAGSSTPVMPGMQVGDGDTLRTAAGGRVYLDLPEHSRVKLGENTEFTTPSLVMAHDEHGAMFKGVLHILKGVFRFTTSLVGKSERRDLSIQVGVATIGVRGTDVWGRAGTDGSLVALLEGKISMDMPGHPGMTMEQPMHYMMMPAAGEMQMNVPVTQGNMSDWTAQTDVAPGAGVLTNDGHWMLALLSSTDPDDSTDLMWKLVEAGYPAEDTTVMVKGKTWHRLVIRQAASYKDAKTLADRIKQQFPLMSPWVLKQK
ncbi:MAG: FecR domain-containing protein [Gammaproteobacteria bacterium]